MSDTKIILLFIVGLLLFLTSVSLFISIVKFIRNGFQTKEDIALQKAMKKELEKQLYN